MIPAEAVEAAAQALRDAFDWGVDGFEEQAKRALEAAAPHMLAARPVPPITEAEWDALRRLPSPHEAPDAV